MKRTTRFGVLLLACSLCSQACAAGPFGQRRLDRVNARIHGQLLDFTSNHGADRRIWSPALQERRDLYVYLPPGFDPACRYPVLFWLHGFAQDENSFREDIVPLLDQAIAAGKLPPLIAAAPDGSFKGTANYFSAGSFFTNSDAGRFGDYLMCDVWGFVFEHFPIRPERCAHVLAGVSMGGQAAYHHAIKSRDRVGQVIGIFPPLNLRWLDCKCRHMGNFDPCCWAWRTDFSRPCEVIGRFYLVLTVHLGQVIKPMYDPKDPATLAKIRSENPIEMIDLYHLRPGELEMYIAYGGKDQFNIDAQVESFLFVAKRHGLEPTVDYDPNGRHDRATALSFFPQVTAWLAPRIAPFAPPCGP